jgi:hypothetical protein
MSKTFLAFGSDNNIERQHINHVINLAEKIKEFDIFDDINIYTGEHLQNDKLFWAQHGEFIKNNKRGYGYWIWKPYLIKKTIERLKDGDILLYLDSECRLDLNEKDFLLEYLEIVKEKKILFTPWSVISDAFEYWFCKMDLIHKLNMQNNLLLNTFQNQSCIILIYVCKETRDFFDSMYHYCCEDHHNIDDTPSIIPNHQQYFEHRHDQSVFSLLTKKYGYSTDTINITKCIYRRGS